LFLFQPSNISLSKFGLRGLNGNNIAEILLKVELNIITLTFICFVDISDESSRYPPIPTCHITAIQGDSILLTWDVPNDIYKVLYVVQMKTVEDTKWKIFKGEV
jgi:hypothetical protein